MTNLRIMSGTGTLKDGPNGVEVTNQNVLHLTNTESITKQKYYFECYYGTDSYKTFYLLDGIYVLTEYPYTRHIGTIAFTVDNILKEVKVYIDNVFLKTVKYNQEKIPQLDLYMNGVGKDIINLGQVSFKYPIPAGFEAIESKVNFLLKKDGILNNYNTITQQWEVYDKEVTINNLQLSNALGDVNSLYKKDKNNIVPIDSFTEPYSIVAVYPKDTIKIKANVRIKNSQMSYMNKPLDLYNYTNLTKIKFNYKELNFGLIKIIFSVDGNKWYSYRNNQLKQVSLSKEDLTNYGMSPAQIETIPVDILKMFNLKSIYFAILFSEPNNDSVATVSNISLTMEQRGDWKSVVENKDYDYKYNNKTLNLQVSLFNKGNYKINYKETTDYNEESLLNNGYSWSSFEL